jgi:hypothetical protein
MDALAQACIAYDENKLQQYLAKLVPESQREACNLN